LVLTMEKVITEKKYFGKKDKYPLIRYLASRFRDKVRS
jgi:hypothetical protein